MESSEILPVGVFIALLRAVNVGGTGKLPMARLRKLCEDAGFTGVTTYIQSGNVVFSTRLKEPGIRKKLESALEGELGKPVGVLVRTREELEGVLAGNPFKAEPPNRVMVLFLSDPPPAGALTGLKTPGGERVRAGTRELYVHYPDGQGASKLKLPLANVGTARNVNTVTKLIELARAAEQM